MRDTGKQHSITLRHRPVSVSSASSLESFIESLPMGSTEDNEIMNAAERINESHEQQDPDAQNGNRTCAHSNDQQQIHSNSDISPTMKAPAPDAVASLPMIILPPNQISLLTMPGTNVANSIPEFLYQLTKMLTDDNREIIEWSAGKIEVHNPHKLESHVLHKYFRHSKFASFQRQLNYFGFRKLAGKGKMAPCSYINDSATEDLGSILLIKRKTSATPLPKEKVTSKKPGAPKTKAASAQPTAPAANPVLAGILQKAKGSVATSSGGIASSTLTASSSSTIIVPSSTQPQHKGTSTTAGPLSAYQALAQQAVGRGIRHSFVKPAPLTAQKTQSLNSLDHQVTSKPAPPSGSTMSLPQLETHSNLSELESNYRSTLSELSPFPPDLEGAEPTPLSQMKAASLSPTSGSSLGFLSRNSSLIDLAMLPTEEDDAPPSTDTSRNFGMTFVDFPNADVFANFENSESNKDGEGS